MARKLRIQYRGVLYDVMNRGDRREALFGDGQPRVGSTVATVGFPNIGLQGFAPKLAKGEVVALSGAQDDPRCFQRRGRLQLRA
jgi:hypothetical protein